MSRIAGLMAVALLVGAALLGCAQDGRVQEDNDPGDSNSAELAQGNVPEVTVTAERPANLMPEVESVASRSAYAGAFVGSPSGALAN